MADLSYKTNTDVFLGQIQLFIGGIVHAFGNNVKLTVTTEMVDATNFMAGDWKDEIPGLKSFTVTADALLSYKTGAVSYESILDKQLAGDLIEFKFTPTVRSGNETDGYTYAADTTKPSYGGNLHITSTEITSDATKKLVSYSMNANGSGALTKIAAVAA